MPLYDCDQAGFEHALNEALVGADIANGYEEYLRIVELFYADDVEVSIRTHEQPLVGKTAVRTAILGVLVPLQLMAERGSVSALLMYSQKTGDDRGEEHAEWRLELLGVGGRSVNVSWSSARRWHGSRVVYERHCDERLIDGALALLNLG